LRRLAQIAVVDVRPLRRHRDFRLLFIGQGVSFLGGRIRDVAIPFQIYQLTHSSLAVGLIGLVEIVPILGFAFLGGALADAQDRRRMVLLSEMAFAAMSAVLLVNAALPTPQVWVIFAATAVMAALDALQRPSLDAMLPRLVDREELTAAAAVGAFSTTAGMIAGPALGGVSVAVIGLPATYGVDIASYGVSLVALQMMRSVPPPPDAERPSLRRVVEGLRYARSRPELMGTYLVDMVAMFFGMPLALFPAIASQYGGPSVLGLLYAAPALGAFVASGTSGWTNHVHRHGLAVLLAAAMWGVGIIGFGIATWLPLGVFFLAVAGGADMVSGIFRGRIWNQTIPDSLRGRLAGIELISYSSGPALSGVESGAVAALFNVRVSVISGGVLCVIGTGLMALALPAFVAYDGRSSRL
jgi:MFS family permease